MAGKSTDWRPGPTVCRCCLTEGCYKDISTEYFWMGKREVYAEMLSDTFNVSISYSKSGGPNSNSRLICEPCISRLRDASDFRRQVIECEKTFMHHLDPGTSTVSEEIESIIGRPLGTDVKLERVKLEKSVSDDDDFDCTFPDDDDDDDDMDDQPLTKLASKIPKKESVDIMDLLDNAKAAEKRKSTTKLKSTPTKKTKIVKKEVKLVKPGASKTTTIAKDDKKKKELGPHRKAKRNAEIVLKYTTVYPFRLRGKVLVCVYCWEEFNDPTELRDHIDMNHQKFKLRTAFNHLGIKEYLKVDCCKLKCRLCLESFDSLFKVAEHLTTHNQTDIQELDLGYEVGMQPYNLIKDNGWTCAVCKKKVPSIVRLCRHTTSHYTKFTCDICGRSYLTNEGLKYHLKCNHSGKVTCRKCWEEFPSMEAKREHVRASQKCWPFLCTRCGQRFLSWEIKQKHMVTEHKCPQASYPCPECDMTFQLRKHFYTHYKVEHSDEAFICSCCGLKFNSNCELEDHRLSHTGEKSFQCNICSKLFARNKSLTQHMWIHSEVKRFVCVICSKPFAQKVSLKGHMKSYHPEVEILF